MCKTKKKGRNLDGGMYFDFDVCREVSEAWHDVYSVETSVRGLSSYHETGLGGIDSVLTPNNDVGDVGDGEIFEKEGKSEDVRWTRTETQMNECHIEDHEEKALMLTAIEQRW